MKKLSKEQLKAKAEISKNLEAARAALEESVEKTNKAIAAQSVEKTNKAIAAHNELVAKYNEAVEEAKQWSEFEGFDPEEAVEEEEISADLEDGFDDLPNGVDN